MSTDKFPTTIVEWLRTKVLNNPKYLEDLINPTNYKAIENKYQHKLNLQIAEYRRLELVNVIWLEFQKLASEAKEPKTKESAGKFVNYLRNQRLLDKREFYKTQDSKIQTAIYEFSEICHVDGIHIEDACPICYESYTQTDMVMITTCAHAFHLACIEKWLITHKQCPLCRRVIV